MFIAYAVVVVVVRTDLVSQATARKSPQRHGVLTPQPLPQAPIAPMIFF